MKKVIQFGAGNIGRGFIGALFSKSEYHVVFADVNNELIEYINTNKEYTIHIKNVDCTEEKIKNISGVIVTDNKILKEIVEAEIITTAVGINILPQIASVIAQGIKNRKEKENKSYLNIIACEDTIEASSRLKEEIEKYLNKDEINYLNKYVGFPNCLTDKIVMQNIYDNVLDIVAEEHYEFYIEAANFKGTIPRIIGANIVDNLMAYIERNIFTLNTIYAITAYLGLLRGYKTIEESINDKFIYDLVKELMKESVIRISSKYDFDEEVNQNYIDKTINRLRNPYLQIGNVRTGKEPLRRFNEYVDKINSFNNINNNSKIFNMLKNDVRRN